MRLITAAVTLLAASPVLARNAKPAPLRRDLNPLDEFPAYNFSIPVDHFHNDSLYEPHSNDSFNNRYWFDASHYKQGGPVIMLQAGEASGTDRVPILQNGILQQLAQLTNGIAVVIEHRYYGTSFPVANLTTENLRFLSHEQALADWAYFAQNIVFPGFEDLNVTAPGTPWLAYGGSYAGAFVAFLRYTYPDLFYGAISSSGVTAAVYDFWEYYEPIREYGPSECVDTHVKLVNILDNILMSGDNSTIMSLKAAFNSTGITYDPDFANIVTETMSYWQNRNWDPAINDPTFYEYCGNITNSTNLWPSDESLTANVSSLVEAGGWGNESSTLTTALANMIGFNNVLNVESCGGDLDECYGTNNASAAHYTDRSIDNYSALSWNYQVCTVFGWWQTGSGVPSSYGLPLISRLTTPEYYEIWCKNAYNITTMPDLERCNKYGGFNYSYPRVALVGGQADPWRPATPLAALDTPDRLNGSSTIEQPIFMIQGGVHHWDENGIFPNETTATLPPPSVRDTQEELGQIVQSWLAQWAQEHPQ